MNFCVLCKRASEEDSDFEFHHFEPVVTRRKTKDGIWVCHQCGDQVHTIFTNTQIREMGDDINQYLTNDRMMKYLNWVRSKPLETHFSVALKKKKMRKHSG